MSINVTVHGNPISIKKGKMVTCDTDAEFERRRRIRLQQVRQQSKDIAADVRNRVRKERERQLCKAEQKGEEDLKRWQARKLLQLQNQYQECLKEMGSAQNDADQEPDADETLQEIAEKNQKEAEIRGRIAAKKQKKEEREKQQVIEEPIERKRAVKKMEDIRASMVTKLNKGTTTHSSKRKNKRKKVSTDVTISNNLVTDTDTDHFMSDRENISANIHFPDGTRKKTKLRLMDGLSTPETSPKRKQKLRIRLPPENKYSQRTCRARSSPKSDTSFNDTSTSDYNQTFRSTTPPLPSPPRPPSLKKFTKVSDRIKQRKIKVVDKDVNTTDDLNVSKSDKSVETSYCQRNFNIENYQICDITCEEARSTEKQQTLPYVPTTTLRQSTIETQLSRTKPQTVVQKISKDSIEVHPPSERDESDFQKMMQDRDKMARNRGAKAMEKTRIEKDYKELMEKLPILQKQERIASMKMHNPAFHMPEDRLQELEKRRQSRIENIFEKYYQKSKTLETPLVTLRPIQKSPPGEEIKLPFRCLDMTESPTQINVAEWKSEEKYVNIARPSPVEDINQKHKALVDLLQRVNKQRELLMQEVSALPASSNLQTILEADELFQTCCPCPKNSQTVSKNQEKQEKTVKTVTSTGTSPLLVKSSTKSQLCECDNSKTSSSSSSSESIEETRKKKTSVKKLKTIKNEGTQTSPVQTKPVEPLKEQKISSEDCVCDPVPEEKDESRKVCEIIIKMNKQSEVKINTENIEKKEPPPPGKKSVILNLTRPNTKITIRSPNNNSESSTTYMSIPDVKHKKESTIRFKQQYKDMLHQKPQQTNIDEETKPQPESETRPCRSSQIKSKEITPNLLKYIQKLLSMSRQSIDELTVSTVSDVTTPGSSVCEASENRSPVVQLQNVMEYYNLSITDVQRLLETSDISHSSTEYGKVQEPKESTSEVKTTNETAGTSKTDQKDLENKKSLLNFDENDSKIEISEETRKAFGLEEIENITYTNILAKYTELTQSCCDKISKLTAMIEKVRVEKEILLSPAHSDNFETSTTSYMELPKDINGKTEEDKGSSTSSSLSQEALNRFLLTIEKDSPPGSSPNCDPDKCKTSVSNRNIPGSSNNQENFVPMLQGIPKCSEPYSNNHTINFFNSPMKQFFANKKPKPPPSLLRASGKSFNIDMIPHELSTIVELDTVLSSKNISDVCLNRARSPQDTVPSRDEATGFETINSEPPKNSPKDKKSLRKSKSPRKSSIKNSKSTSPSKEKPKSDISGVQLLISDQSSSSPENMEAILRNMGLGWAVSTLKKTHEALALSSSSSSVDTSYKKRVSFKNSTGNISDVSVKEILSKELVKQLSSTSSSLTNSSSKSDVLLQLRESCDISDISPATESQHQRTSTPVTQSKSTDSKNNIFVDDSDMSSVRLHSDENLFLSIPNVSLDTNKSLSKSKT